MISEFFAEVDPGIIGLVVTLVVVLLAKGKTAKYVKEKGREQTDEEVEFPDLDEDPEIRELKKMLGKMFERVKPLPKASIPQKVQFPDVKHIGRKNIPAEAVKPACLQKPVVQPVPASQPSFASKTHHSAPTVKKSAEVHKTHLRHQTVTRSEQPSVALFSSEEELRRAIIYSEIMQPKFKEEE